MHLLKAQKVRNLEEASLRREKYKSKDQTEPSA